MKVAQSKYKYAGISKVYKPDGTVERSFNATKREGSVGIRLDVPGRVVYDFLTLPNPMNKLEAAKFLKASHEDYSNQDDQDFLQSVIDKREPQTKKRVRKTDSETQTETVVHSEELEPA